MEPLDIQLYRVSVMILAGAATGLLLDIYRIFRWATSPRGFIVYLEDLVFWIILTPLLIFSLLVSNWVDLRLYMLIGFGLGLGSYLLLASPVVLLAFKFTIRVIERVLGAAKRVCRWLYRRAIAVIRRLRESSRRVTPVVRRLRSLAVRASGVAGRLRRALGRLESLFPRR